MVGQGDMLLLPGNSSVANRIQGSWVGEEEVRQVVEHWRAQAPEPIYSSEVEGDEASAAGGGAGERAISLMSPLMLTHFRPGMTMKTQSSCDKP